MVIMWAKDRQSKGFTIVELLIVVVVIAILAAITIVSYRGITNRAAKVADVSTIQAYTVGIQQLAIMNDLPTANACLGPASTYPATTGNCPGGGQTATKADSALLNAKLKTVGVKDATFIEPTGVTPMMVYGYYGFQNFFILYNMPADQDCGVSDIMSFDASNNPVFVGAKYSYRQSDATICFARISTSS